MENQSLLLTLTLGTVISFVLFFVFYAGLKLSSKLSALLTILAVEIVYIPLVAFNWPGLDVFAIHFAFFTMVPYGLGMITSQRDTQQRYDQRHGTDKPVAKWRFHWAPATIVGFFIVLACVDGLIITLANKGADASFMQRFLPEPRSGNTAVSAFPGVVSHDFKEKYDQFNSYINQLKVQNDRGWKLTEGWKAKPIVGQDTLFEVALADRDGKPITQGQATIHFLRPANQKFDQQVQLLETAPGHYGNQIKLSEPGLWQIVIKIQQDTNLHEVKGTTWVQPAS
ncbi:FixH family protein [Thiofilum flexile]|uniref:FixH family protein n=1 Tax=Thiofilum flexile TaxID=125627 RepID=UPI00037B1279|nr:FixH family protein [Thiofilum flexile]